MDQQPTDADLKDCVAFASVENMRKLEEKRTFWLAGSRMRPGDKSNPDSFKVRRAKVGGYRDYFDEHQLVEIGNQLPVGGEGVTREPGGLGGDARQVQGRPLHR